MSSVLETLSFNELLTRKKNLIYQLEKVDEEICKRKIDEMPPEVSKIIKNVKVKISVKK
jgi:hypothetical protein